MASSREPQTQAGQALMNRALALNAAGRRAFPWGSKLGSGNDQPLWSGYFGERACGRAALHVTNGGPVGPQAGDMQPPGHREAT